MACAFKVCWYRNSFSNNLFYIFKCRQLQSIKCVSFFWSSIALEFPYRTNRKTLDSIHRLSVASDSATPSYRIVIPSATTYYSKASLSPIAKLVSSTSRSFFFLSRQPAERLMCNLEYRSRPGVSLWAPSLFLYFFLSSVTFHGRVYASLSQI